MISVATLIAAGIGPTLARAFEAPLIAACAEFGIDSPVRVAHFIAQTGHESLGFAHLEESMFYSRPEGIRTNWPTRVTSLTAAQALTGKPELLANTVYSNRYGNGDAASGDGWKFIGRGLIQLTFRDNYARCGAAINVPLETGPRLAATPEIACRTAGWYWLTNHLNARADTGSVETVTRGINPKMIGLEDRKRRTAQALEAFA